jgi:repressor LexA
MSNTVGSKIKSRREELGLSQESLARKLGYTSRSSIAKIENGTNLLTQPKIEEFAAALDVTPAYLMGWEEPSNVYPVDAITIFEEIGTVKAGYDGTINETPTGRKIEIPTSMLSGGNKDNYFVLRVSGSSMYPRLLDGDTILCWRCDSVNSGDIAVLIYDSDEATVKKVNYIEGQDWLELIPFNPEFPTKRIEGAELEQCRVLGKVVKLIRDI